LAELRLVEKLRAVPLILAVLEEDGFGVGVGMEEAEEFGTAIPGEAGDADLIFIHRTE
jgi:hypothetical protein